MGEMATVPRYSGGGDWYLLMMVYCGEAGEVLRREDLYVVVLGGVTYG